MGKAPSRPGRPLVVMLAAWTILAGVWVSIDPRVLARHVTGGRSRRRRSARGLGRPRGS